MDVFSIHSCFFIIGDNRRLSPWDFCSMECGE